MARRVGILAADSMKGRATPSAGLEAAAAYIAGTLSDLGLQAGGTEGYMYRYDLETTHLDTAGVLLEAPGTGGPTLVLGRDFIAMGATAGDASGPVVWAGPAATSPDAGGLSMTGRVILYDLPVATLDEASVQKTFQADQDTQLGGAVSVVFVVSPDFTEAEMATAASVTVGWSRSLPTVWIRDAAAASLLSAVGADLAQLRAGGPQALDATLHVRAALATETSHPPNVVATLPGSDPELRRQYVVVSAHFDHLGTGLPDEHGDSIFNGADDNASGTAAVLEVAEALASLDAAPARSVLFLLVSGEERGLIGSSRYMASPTVPASDMVADVNMDMIGRNDPGTIIDVGGPYSTLGATLRALAARTASVGLSVISDPTPEEHLFLRSDQLSFACSDVPAILLHSGLHEDYHRTSDELARLNTDKAARVARLALYLTWEVAGTVERPAWTDEGRSLLAQYRGCR